MNDETRSPAADRATRSASRQLRDQLRRLRVADLAYEMMVEPCHRRATRSLA